MNNGGSYFSNIPTVTLNLIIINLLIWLAFISLGHIVPNLNSYYQSLSLHYWELSDFRPHQLFTYMFLHDRSSILHVFMNMFNLFMFGVTIERTWGPKKFLFFYISCGLGAALVQELFWSCEFANLNAAELIDKFSPENAGLKSLIAADGHLLEPVHHNFGTAETVTELRTAILDNMEYGIVPPVVGASGAGYGILAAFAMLFPNLPLFLMFIPIPVKAKYMVTGFILLELYFGITGTQQGVAHIAHLGGAFVGIIMVLIWRRNGDSGPII